VPKKDSEWYSDNFKNTSSLPYTTIFKYMKQHFDKEKDYKEEKLTFDDCFIFKDIIDKDDLVVSIDTPIKKNPEISLDDFLSYAFYIKTKSAFINERSELTSKDEYLETLKYQMGKDIARDDRTINDKEYKAQYFAQEPDYDKNEVADKFYIILIDYFGKIDKKIDYDTINKISLISCQNLFNLITDMVVQKLTNVIKRDNSVFRPEKSAKITINSKKITMELQFKSTLIISKGFKEPMDPEYPCGNLSFDFLIDFKKNTFKFKTFKLDYNINNCGPPEPTPEPPMNTNSKINYVAAIPAAAGIGGIVSIPFILGAIGGKYKKTFKNKNNKKNKNKKTKNNKKNKNKKNKNKKTKNKK
jgi:hypothetical protein